jgi:hypothetical protein
MASRSPNLDQQLDFVDCGDKVNETGALAPNSKALFVQHAHQFGGDLPSIRQANCYLRVEEGYDGKNQGAIARKVPISGWLMDGSLLSGLRSLFCSDYHLSRASNCNWLLCFAC